MPTNSMRYCDHPIWDEQKADVSMGEDTYASAKLLGPASLRYSARGTRQSSPRSKPDLERHQLNRDGARDQQRWCLRMKHPANKPHLLMLKQRSSKARHVPHRDLALPSELCKTCAETGTCISREHYCFNSNCPIAQYILLMRRHGWRTAQIQTRRRK